LHGFHVDLHVKSIANSLNLLEFDIGESLAFPVLFVGVFVIS